jgi:hypothetical protein
MRGTIMTTTTHMDAHYLDVARRKGWVAAAMADVARLVAAGLLERIDGKGKNKGNTPVWAPTAAALEAWATEGMTERRTVWALSAECIVLEDRGENLLVLRRGSRVVIPAAIARPV